MARVITAPGIVRNVSKYLNSMRRVPFAIGKDDWTEVDSSTYTYEFVTAYVTTSSFDIGTFDNSVRSYAKGDISMEKKNGGGGMVFTTTKRPTGTVSGSIYIWDNNDNKVPVILEDTVVPIENGGTGATSVPGILSNLGLGSANDAQETLEFGDAVHKDVANNVTTTSEGYLLDARQGKVLKDSVDALNSKSVVSRGAFTGDANSLYTNGVYRSTNGSISNVPDNDGSLIVLNSEGHSTTQLFIRSDGVMLTRICWGFSSTTWTSWEQLALNSKTTTTDMSFASGVAPTWSGGVSADKFGEVVNLNVDITISSAVSGYKKVFTLPSGYIPTKEIEIVGANDANNSVCLFYINVASGEVRARSTLAASTAWKFNVTYMTN